MGNSQVMKLDIICNCLKESNKVEKDIFLQISHKEINKSNHIIKKIILIQSHFRKLKAKIILFRTKLGKTTAKSFEVGLDLTNTKSIDNYFLKGSDISNNNLGLGKSFKKVTKRSKPSIMFLQIEENQFPAYH